MLCPDNCGRPGCKGDLCSGGGNSAQVFSTDALRQSRENASDHLDEVVEANEEKRDMPVTSSSTRSAMRLDGTVKPKNTKPVEGKTVDGKSFNQNPAGRGAIKPISKGFTYSPWGRTQRQKEVAELSNREVGHNINPRGVKGTGRPKRRS